MTVEEAQQAASDIASRYRVYECDQCAAAIAKRLGRIVPLIFERLRTSDGSDIIALVQEGIQISRNKTHVGVRVGDRIYDNLHHDGVPAHEWVHRFAQMDLLALVHDAQPVSTFFRKVFLTRRFRRWSSGA